jgi:hypothetical protein
MRQPSLRRNISPVLKIAGSQWSAWSSPWQATLCFDHSGDSSMDENPYEAPKVPSDSPRVPSGPGQRFP